MTAALEPHPMIALRKALGWSQDKLSVESGICNDAICWIERRKRIPRLDTRRRLLKALGEPFERHREVFGERKGAA